MKHSIGVNFRQAKASVNTCNVCRLQSYKGCTGCKRHAACLCASPIASTSATGQQRQQQQAQMHQQAPHRQARQQLLHRLSGAGLPLTAGLRVLPGGAADLVGWQVMLQKPYSLLGEVTEVEQIGVQAGGPSYCLLRVHKDSVLQPYGFKGQEIHTLPLVPDIIPTVHIRQHVLIATPPPGLLDVGRREPVLAFLAQELLPYSPGTPHQGLQELVREAQPLLDIRCMPTKQQLLAAGRHDLVALISKVGGFAQVALLLGFKAPRRPVGYWDNLETLDTELDQFIAGSWVCLPVATDQDDAVKPSAGHQATPSQQQQQPEFYYYNMATRSIRWELPPAVEALLTPAAAAAGRQDSNLQDAALAPGGKNLDLDVTSGSLPAVGSDGVSRQHVHRALLALAEDRVMPLQNCLRAAGRWDLHTAITRHGGYKAVAEQLERRLSWPLHLPLQDPETLADALSELAVINDWDPGVLATARQLQEAGRGDIVRAILHHGGWHATAQLLQLTSRRQPAGRAPCSSLEALVAAMRDFMAHNTPDTLPLSTQTPAARRARVPTTAGQHSQQTAGNVSKSVTASMQRLRQYKQHRRVQQHQLLQKQLQRQPPVLTNLMQQQQQQQCHCWTRLPTQAELLAAGRPDLAAGLQRYGHDCVGKELSLPQSARKRLKKGALHSAAVAAAVRAGCHTSSAILAHITAQAHSMQQPQQQQYQHQSDGLTQSLGGQQHLVTREHLVRQLKVWCNQGLLVKTRRGYYDILGTRHP